MSNLKSEMKDNMDSIKASAETAGMKAKYAAKVTGAIASTAAKEMVNAASDIGKTTADAAKEMKNSIKNAINSEMK